MVIGTEKQRIVSRSLKAKFGALSRDWLASLRIHVDGIFLRFGVRMREGGSRTVRNFVRSDAFPSKTFLTNGVRVKGRGIEAYKNFKMYH